MSLINNAVEVTGAGWTLLFDSANDGGSPIRGIKIENASASEGPAEVLVAPIHTLSTDTPGGGVDGVHLAVGASEEFIGSVNGQPSITKAWIRPVTDTDTVTINSFATAR